MRTRSIVALFMSAGLCSSALGWDAHGHRTITLLAIDKLASEVQKDESATRELAFALAPSGRAQAAYQAGEPDRYRAIRLGQLKHENDPEHYLDVEDLEPFGLTLLTMPPLRNEYVRAMVIAKHVHPENMRPYNEKTDVARTQEFPGFLAHASIEHYGKLVSSFRQVRVLEALKDPARADQLAAARANVLYEMGYLSHLIGDAAQPLHTTRHHHGWVDDNPEDFTTNRGFHAYIDTTVLGIHALSHDTMKDLPITTITVNKNDPWTDILQHVQRSFDKVRPLYVLQKSGDLEKEPGKAFIQERLVDGAAMLSALYVAAWKASEASEKDIKDFVMYDQVSSALPNPMEPKKPVQPTIEGQKPAAK